MARKDITPFEDGKRDDIIATLRYIQEHKDAEAKLKAEREEAEQWLRETLDVDAEKEGTSHYGDPDDFVTFEVRTTYSVDASKMQELVETNQISAETLDRVIDWKPSLKVSPYRDLDEGTRAMLAQAITAKTGKPTIRINVKES